MHSLAPSLNIRSIVKGHDVGRAWTCGAAGTVQLRDMQGRRRRARTKRRSFFPPRFAVIAAVETGVATPVNVTAKTALVAAGPDKDTRLAFGAAIINV